MDKLVITLLSILAIIDCNVQVKEIIEITELKKMEPINLNPSCSITEIADSKSANYNFISTFEINDVISDIYDEYFEEYNSSLLVIDGYNNPMPGDVTTYRNNFDNILLCYSGCKTNDTYDDNKYIYCKLFYNTSSVTNDSIVNKPDELNLMTVNYPQTILNHKNNLFLIFYSKYFTMNQNFISYSIIDNNNKLLTLDEELNLDTPKGDEPGVLKVISAEFNQDLFLITMTYYNLYKLIGWIGRYDDISKSVQILNQNYFEIINNEKVYNFENYGTTISLDINDNCCFITPYFTNEDLTTNKLYLTIFDINGTRIFNNDTYISTLNNLNMCGGVTLKMINNNTSKYFLIYTMTNYQVNGYIFNLVYYDNGYKLDYINSVNLQNETQIYRSACFSILNDKLSMVSLTQYDQNNTKIYGQSWSVLND